jgi:hypothetical protein
MHRSHLALASCRRRRFQLRHGQLLVSLLQAATHRRQLHGGVLSPPPSLRRCRQDVRFCRYRFKFQSNLVWDSIKSISNFCFQF